MAIDEDSAQVLCEEILSEARRQGEEMVARARQDAEGLLTRAAREAEAARVTRLDRGKAEAARRREMILATVPVEAGRMRAERVEALLDAVQEEVRGRLLTGVGFEYREILITLASFAVPFMTGNGFVVKVPEADRSVLGDGLAGEIAARAGCAEADVTVLYEPYPAGAGVVVEDPEGRRMWDNRLATRLTRMWPELRQRIAVAASFIPEAGLEGDNP